MDDTVTPDPKSNPRPPARHPTAQRVSVAEIMRRAAAAGQPLTAAFSHGALSLGLYTPYRMDPQKPHGRDELYIVVKGSGVFYDGTTRQPVHAGDALFVPAGLEHRFEDFTDDLTLWAVFTGAEPRDT